MTIREAVLRDLLPLLQRHVPQDKWGGYIAYYCGMLKK